MSLTMNRALAIAAYVGVPHRKASPKDYVFKPEWQKSYLRYSWNGKFLLVTNQRKPIDVLHEVCHWLVAKPEERPMPEFGLGDAPYTDVRSAIAFDEEEQVISKDYSLHELREVETCILELQVLAACGGNWRKRADYLNFEAPKRCSFWDWIKTERGYPESPLFMREYAQELAEVR